MAVYTSNASYYVLMIEGAHVYPTMSGTCTDAEASSPKKSLSILQEEYLGLFGLAQIRVYALLRPGSSCRITNSASKEPELYPEAPK